MKHMLWLSLCLLGLTARADDFTLDWHTVGAGGAMWTSNAEYKLSGTIGQLDTIPFAMTGGGYTLYGGFWPGAYSAIFGDCDNSWSLTIEDFRQLTKCLAGPEAPMGMECTCLKPDSDDDGDCDLRDYAEFQKAYGISR